jgi:transcriptional regulator with XRE-family HTH domain
MGAQESDVAAFGRRLRTVRRQLGVSQHDLASRAGIRESEVGRYERGGREPRLTAILRLARGLSVPPGTLLDKLMADI